MKNYEINSQKCSLYIHLPFCDKKCFYCAFPIVVGQHQRVDRYLRCIDRESKIYKCPKMETLYIGGGTPTFLTACQLRDLFQNLRSNFDCSGLTEVTVEANPEGLSEDKLSVLKEEGVTRISLGVQTFQDKYLKYLGRIHARDQIFKSYDLCRRFFDNVNVDLMFNFPHQTQTELDQDLSDLMSLGSEHVSIYSLTIEAPSRFFTRQVQLASDEIQGRYYQHVVASIAKMGCVQYEVSNFARSGFESLHNMHYWQMGEYIGLGMGAHSFWNGRRYANVSKLSEYMDKSESGVSTMVEESTVSTKELFQDALVFGLRMNRGVSLKELSERYGAQLSTQQERHIQTMVEEGMFVWSGKYLQATDRGRVVLDEISLGLI